MTRKYHRRAPGEPKKHDVIGLVCPVCGVPLAGHPKCEGCAMLFGEGHQRVPAPGRLFGHRVCDKCAEESDLYHYHVWDEVVAGSGALLAGHKDR